MLGKFMKYPLKQSLHLNPVPGQWQAHDSWLLLKLLLFPWEKMGYLARSIDTQMQILSLCTNMEMVLNFFNPSFLFCKTRLIIRILHRCCELQMRSHTAQNMVPRFLQVVCLVSFFSFFNGRELSSEEYKATDRTLEVLFKRKILLF